MFPALKPVPSVVTALGLLVCLSGNITAARHDTLNGHGSVRHKVGSDLSSPLQRSGRPLAAPTTVPGNDLAGAEWTLTGSMQHPRWPMVDTMTLLPSGNVLVVGGAGATTDVSGTVEIYEPVTGRWSLTGPLLEPVGPHTATLLPSGQVLVLGESALDHEPAIPQLYTAATGTWAPTELPVTPRMGHTATLLSSGKVLVAGGLLGGRYLETAELYDPATGTWSPAGTLTARRGDHRAVLLRSGRVLIQGGFTGPFWIPEFGWGYSLLGTAEVYNPATGTWSATASPSHADRSTLTMLRSGRVLLVGSGGASPRAEVYDELTGGWSLTDTPSRVRGGHTATLLPSGRVLIAGGSEASQPGVPGGDLASAELYDPATGLWQETASMTGPRTSHAAILLRTGAVLVAGGYTGLLPEGLIGPAELYTEEPAACGQDISSQVDVVTYPPWTVSLFLRFQFVVIRNKTTLPIAGPLALVMHDLERAAFIGTNFRTGCFGDDDPFTLVPIGSDNVLSPNESTLQGLWFFKTAIGPLSYSPIAWSAISPE